jgi:flagellar protein FliS
MAPDFRSNVYQQMEVTTANNLQLVVLLYEGAIRFLTEAKDLIEKRDLAGKAQAINRTFAILGELQSTLELEGGGEIAASLDRLYIYMMDRLLEASRCLNVDPLDEVIKLLRLLNSAWIEIAQETDKVAALTLESPLSTVPHQTGRTQLSQHPLEVVA